jgi:hypothetical protein
MKRKAKGSTRRQPPRRRPVPEPREVIEEPEPTPTGQPGTSPRLSGGDVDADWAGAESAGDETVGGSVATPDQDVVDEIGRALGVEQASDAEVVTSGEILKERDRFRWHLDRDAEDRERKKEEKDEKDEEGR